MIIEKELHYTSEYTFEKLKSALDTNDVEEIIEAFDQRVNELYIEPAKSLIEHAKSNNKNFGFIFSAGLICVSAIDFLGHSRFPSLGVRERFTKWMKEYIKGFPEELEEDFYENFRNGLVHECRIKNGGEFSLKRRRITTTLPLGNEKCLIVNPDLLLSEIKDSIKKYIKDVREKPELFEKLKKHLRRDFASDFGKENANEG